MAGHMISNDIVSVQSAPDRKGLDEGCTDSGRLNFVRWRLIFAGPQYGTWLHVATLAPRNLRRLLDF